MKRIEIMIGVAVATLFAATAFLAIFLVARLIYAPAPLPRPVYPTEASLEAVATAESPAAEAGAGTVDLAAGARAWGQCRACHAITPDGRPGVGPNLWGVFGTAVGSVEGFAYSDALAGATGQVWDAAALDAFLTRPADAFPGNRMAFLGVRDVPARQNLIAWISQQSDSPATLVAAAAETAEAPAVDPAEASTDVVSDEEYQALLAAFAWMNPSAQPAVEAEEARARADAIIAALPGMDYEAARFHPLHYPPASLAASNEECLACHAEILSHRPREASQAGVPATASIAWYQTLDTYADAQESFHHRHMQSDFAQLTMNLECRFCHQANDPREESPDMIVGLDNHTAPVVPEFTLRRMVNPSTTCLMCHGTFPAEVMGLEGHWLDLREDFEWEPGVNGCLSCHEDTFRTNRHQVSFLNAGNIEALARTGSSDSCYGCHGGRAWYMNSFPYARNPWPGMDEAVPDWAVGRPTASDPHHAFTPVNPAD